MFKFSHLLLLVFCLLLPFDLYANQTKALTTATGPVAAAKILPKLDEILKNQETILKELEELKKEIAIVKIRATR